MRIRMIVFGLSVCLGAPATVMAEPDENGEATAEESCDLRAIERRATALRGKLEYEKEIEAWEQYLACNPRGPNRRKAQNILKDLAIAKTTRLRVEIADGTASVSLKSKSIGVWCKAAPTCPDKGLLPGRYRIYIEREGFEPVRETVVVDRNATTTFKPDMVEHDSPLTIEVSPKDAKVELDGEVLDPSQWSTEIPAGTHTIVVSLDGFATYRKSVEARQGKSIAVSATLAELLEVDVEPADAELFLDGEPVPFQDGNIELPPGPKEHRLTAKADGHRDKTVEIAAKRPRRHRVSLTLEEEPEPAPEPVKIVERETKASSEWTRTKLTATASSGAAMVTGLAAGAFLALSGQNKWNEAQELCQDTDDGLTCGPEGLAGINSARRKYAQANLAFSVSAIGAVGLLWSWNMNDDESGISMRRKLSIGATAAIAAGGLTVGTIYGLRSRSGDSCPKEGCDPQSYASRIRASDSANTANLGFAVAGIAATSAVLLWLTAPPSTEALTEPNAIGVTPTIDIDGVGIQVTGAF